MALIGSGLLAILLVLSRTPGIQDVFPLKDFFRSALVVHVDLSVAIWFMAFAAVIWSALGRGGLAWMGWFGFVLATIGTAVMTVSPFLPGADLAFKADADCFVHVVWWDSNGNVGRLFPNPKLTEGSGEIKAGETHWLPYKQGKHWY